jgi:peptidoglycan/LPS O-acetylase OafA/YrhL
MSRVPGLDLLRAIAIAWVMYSHAQTFDLVPESDLVARFGWMGVDLFFVLSGLLIGGQLMGPLTRGEPLEFRRFWLRRALRIFPAYFAVVALYFAFPRLQEWGAIQPVWQFLTFTENWFIHVPPAKTFSHVWSLCVEEHFYLTAPILVWLLVKRASLRLTLGALGAVVLGGMALRALLWLSLPAPGHGFGPGYLERIYYPSWTRLDGLAAGMTLAALRTFRPDLWTRLVARSNLISVAGLVGVGVSIALFWDQFAFPAAVVGYPLLAASMGLLVASASGPQGVLGCLRIPGIGWLAAVSYSLYLIHKIAFRGVDNAWGHWLSAHPLPAVAAYAAAALAAGSLLHYGIERPFLRLRERLTAHQVCAPSPIAKAA